jgi:acetyl-CoA carboxylase carboxyl transferase subunit alpha
MVIGHQKGRDTKAKIKRNFGMPRPEGYRKALRLMKLAERFRLPLLTFIDTPAPTRASARRSAASPRRSPAT